MEDDKSSDCLERRQADVQMCWDVRIPLRDGICLSATSYLPGDQQSPAPTIFVLTPYVRQIHHEQGMYFAAHGYPFVTVDVRGRGDSQGTFEPNINEARDGHDVVEWLAQQSYCNGQVAMWGGSYMGYAQWAVAKEFPPHLATIVPVAAPYVGVDFPARNNIGYPYILQWLGFISGRTLQDKIFTDSSFWASRFRRWFELGLPFRDLDAHLGNPSAVFQEWVSHAHEDAYWDRYNPTSQQYAKLSLPILTITGIYDGDQPGALTHYRKHRSAAGGARHYLVIGPWDHAGTRVPKAEFGGLRTGSASLIDVPKLHLEWYSWTMQGGPKPQFLQNNVGYYVMGAEKWRYADTIEAVTARSEPFYLRSNGRATDVLDSGSLALEPPLADDHDCYCYDPRDVEFAQLESTLDPASRVDQHRTYASIGKQLVYHSAAFAKDIEISGFFKLSAWLAIDQPDTDFYVAVYEIGSDGRAVQLTMDLMRARYRQSTREQKLIDTRAPLRYDFERFTFVSRLLRKGSRLRLVIGPPNSIYWQRNYNSGGAVAEESIKDARPVNVALFHDEAHPSALYVPFGQPET